MYVKRKSGVEEGLFGYQMAYPFLAPDIHSKYTYTYLALFLRCICTMFTLNLPITPEKHPKYTYTYI